MQNARSNDLVGLTLNDWLDCLKEYNFRCKACRKKYTFLTLDHKVSMHSGGLNNRQNIQPLCSQCHEVKGTVETKLRGNKKKREEAKELMDLHKEIFAL